MKKLIVSMKSADEMFADFKKVAGKISKRQSLKSTHYEISFGNSKDFNRFVKNLNIIMAIQNHKPHSIYQLAKLTDRDLANVKKIVAFFEEIGAVTLKEEKVSGRSVKRPIVDYDRVEFDLRAA